MAVNFEPLSFWWLAAAAALLAVAAAVVAWGRTRRLVGGGRATVFLLLRVGAVLSLLLFVLGPGGTVTYTKAAAPPVAILIDSSASMDLPAGERTRLGASLAAAAAVARAVEESGGEYAVYDFAAGRRPWGDVVPDEEALRRGRRERTDAAGALAELAGRYGREGLTAAAILSDGVWDAAPAARGLPPCFTVSPADEAPAGYLFVTDVDAPAVVLPGTGFDVTARYYSTLAGGDEATAAVAEGGGAEADYILKPKRGRGEAVVRGAVREPGDRFFRVRPSPGWGETWFHVKVLERPLSVWYWEMAGDADFAFLKRALASHAGFELAYRFDVGDAAVGPAPQPPGRTDVIVLGNPRAARMGAAAAEMLARHVERGGGLLIIVSARPVDVAALSTGPLAELLPVRASSSVAESGGGPLTAAAYPGGPRVAAAPPTVTHVWRLGPPKEGATAVWRGPDGAPALVLMRYGLGRVALLPAGGLFKWRLATGDDYAALAAALVLAVYNERVGDLAVSRYVAEPGDVVEVTCRAAAEPTVVCADPRGAVKRVPLAQVGDDLWAGEFDVDAEGRYELTSKSPSAAGIEAARAAVMARPPTSEYMAFMPRLEGLKALAAATGGRYFAVGDVDGLAREVAARVEAAPRVSATARRDLWPAWSAFATALSFLVADWLLRRRTGLP